MTQINDQLVGLLNTQKIISNEVSNFQDKIDNLDKKDKKTNLEKGEVERLEKKISEYRNLVTILDDAHTTLTNYKMIMKLMKEKAAETQVKSGNA